MTSVACSQGPKSDNATLHNNADVLNFGILLQFWDIEAKIETEMIYLEGEAEQERPAHQGGGGGGQRGWLPRSDQCQGHHEGTKGDESDLFTYNMTN